MLKSQASRLQPWLLSKLQMKSTIKKEEDRSEKCIHWKYEISLNLKNL